MHRLSMTFLVPGRHFGEWWGSGIQRGYGLDEKTFSLFNAYRWGWLNEADLAMDHSTVCLSSIEAALE